MLSFDISPVTGLKMLSGRPITTGFFFNNSVYDIKAPYIGYSGVTSFDVNEKITSSGNKFNSTDTTKCMKKDSKTAEATNLTAIR